MGIHDECLGGRTKNYREIRDYVVECQKKYGDEVTYFPGYFPAMYLPRERVNREMSEAIEIISKMVGNGYRPQSIMEVSYRPIICDIWRRKRTSMWRTP